MIGISKTQRDPIEQALKAATARYAGTPREFRWYARLKYRMDPCYRAIARRVLRDSFTVDLGTGLGMLPVLLAELGEGRRVLGVDWDPGKMRCGLQAARGLPAVELVEGDLHVTPLPVCDVITLVDVLHYYETDRQEALLKRCRAALRPGGRLLIREADVSRQGGARWTRLVETWATRLGWNRGPGVHFRPISELRSSLVKLGFRVDEEEVAGRYHPGNVLLEAVVEPPQNP
ncbi:MAG TPA: class I SAM-dependent methyltransferase [Candidatus Polarisedimenticolia bacterium]|nr:class I SAM-dependent methyltransferase [Candidatus Polarisedimenticolia bacterium]